jgi:prepilin-type processing-associated H-X9-DG protein
MKCANNLKQLGLAAHNYHDANRQMPPGQPQGYYAAGWPHGGPERDRSCWVYFVLPYIEQGNLHAQYTAYLQTLPDYTCFAPFARLPIATLLCPSDSESPKDSALGQGMHSNYVACHGNGYATPGDTGGFTLNGIFYGRSKVRMEAISDGTSNTVLFGEILLVQDTSSTHDIRGRIHNSIHAGSTFSTIYPPNSTVGDNPQGYCVPKPRAPCGAQSRANSFILARSGHSGGTNACLADGSVRFVSNNISQITWQAMGSRDGGEVFANE